MSQAISAVLAFLIVSFFLNMYAYLVIPQPINYMYLLMVIVILLLLVGLLRALIRGDLDD